MAAPMRSGQQDAQGHRARVADSCKGATAARGPNQPGQPQQHQTQPSTANFEYDDNEWDIGIGDLIIDLDADIEKTNEQQQPMAANPGGPQASKAAATAKMHIEHSATTDKGLKMKIKRTKPGTKTSEAKHEIVKSNEQNGVADPSELTKGLPGSQGGNKHVTSATGGGPPPSGSAPSLAGSGAQNLSSSSSTASMGVGGNSKRGSSGHRRDKASREKHTERSAHNSSASSSATNAASSQPTTGSSSSSTPPCDNKPSIKTPMGGGPGIAQPPGATSLASGAIASSVDMNGLMRAASALQPGPPRPVFPASTGPGPPPPSPGPPASPAAATAQGSAAKPEQSKVGVAGGPGVVNSGNVGGSAGQGGNAAQEEHGINSTSPPPMKKAKTDPKDTADVCVGTSVGTITEPDCLGPCEPGTSVTLEGIVWHETEGGVLVVNVTWRGKTYVGTLLDCTRHDWAPPRFCDSPTSDLDNRTPKGRETRSSVHSKLRNGGGVKGGRRGIANGVGPVTAPASPAPFVPPRPDNKRKGRAGEEDIPPASGKKAKVVVPAPATTPLPVAPPPCGSPPPSPVLLECPEPNCSKKYKHINGLKYHQSHAHGSVADDDETKDVASMSENDESNIEAPSPVTSVKSPDKSQDSPPTPAKKDASTTEIPSLLSSAGEGGSSPPSPATPQIVHEMPAVVAGSPTVPMVDTATSKPQAVFKPAILRYGASEEYSVTAGGVGVFASSGKPQVQGSPITNTGQLISSRPSAPVSVPTDQIGAQHENTQPQSFTNQLQSHVNMSPQQFSQPPNLIIPSQNSSNPSPMQSQLSPHQHRPPTPTQTAKLTQFKVKPASALMPDEKKPQQLSHQPQMHQQPQTQNGTNLNKPQSFKKKNRKSPAGSPHPPQADQTVGPFGLEQGGRDEVQSPAYSDISDDGAPVMDTEVDKNKNPDKKTETGQALPHMSQYGIYPFYTQPHQYLVPSQQQQQQSESGNKNKESEKHGEKIPCDKETKKDSSDYPSKMLQQHYYPYGYMPGYPYNMEPTYSSVPIVQEEKHKDDRVKETPSPIEQQVKQAAPIPNPIQVPMPGKSKPQDSNLKDKHQNENHQILKESIEIKNQMNPYMYSRQSQPQQQQPQQLQQHHNHREEEARRYYAYSEQRRKEQQQQHQQQNMSDHNKHNNPNLNKMSVPQSSSIKAKEVKIEEKKEKEIKQEGVKPTMETQGPPPPPTSQYAYIHPSYMQSAHYGALPFDPNHPMYRGIMVPGPYSSSPYLHPQIPRYHAPEDLSRAQPPTKALDMLQHHAQYYSSHKIHELQERAIKSPTPKTSVASSSPSTNNAPPSGQSPAQMSAPPTTQVTSTTPSNGKQTPGDNKDSRSPPPQRHVHTHHHTHVGLGYPMYPAPYGAAVLASQQAAAVTVINPYPTK